MSELENFNLYSKEKAHDEALRVQEKKESGETNDYNEAEKLVEKEDEFNKEEFIKKAKEKYDYVNGKVERGEDNIGHQASHYFGGNSYFPGIPETFEMAEDLLNRTIEAEEIRKANYYCLPRLVGSIMEYNINHINKDTVAYAFKPKQLENTSLITKPENEKHYNLKSMIEFCESKDPKDFLVYLFENDFSFIQGNYEFKLKPEKIKDIFEFLQGKVDQKKLDEYALKIENGLSAKDLIENYKYFENAKEFTRGVYVDVDGTLVRDGKINKELLDFLNSSTDKVTIFTNGIVEKKTEELRALSVPEEFLPVRSKEEFKGKILEKVFDDQALTYQGFKALVEISPNLFEEGWYVQDGIGLRCVSREDLNKSGKVIIEEIMEYTDKRYGYSYREDSSSRNPYLFEKIKLLEEIEKNEKKGAE